MLIPLIPFISSQVLKEAKDVVAKENGTGKIYLSGLDRQGRPVMIMRPRLENTFDHDGNIKHLVYQVRSGRHDTSGREATRSDAAPCQRCCTPFVYA